MTFSLFWLAAGAGLLAIITPCVFPLIPVTAAYFSDRGKSRSEAIRSGLFFALGMVFTFCIIGLGAAATIGAAGLSRFASSASVNIGFAVLFTLFGLALHGAHSFALPSGLVNSLHRFAARYDRRSVIGPLLLGAVFSLTSFTCTTPFVGTLLVLASRGEWVMPIQGMLVFSVVFALPFFILSVAPGYTQRLPRSGPWLEKTKQLVGLLELAAAAKFASNADLVMGWDIFNRNFVLAAWVMLGMLALPVLLSNPEARTFRVRNMRIAFTLGIYPVAIWIGVSLSKYNMGELEAFLPPQLSSHAQPLAGGPSGVASADAGWIMNDYNAALAQSRSTGKLVFVDFTGYTCTNCRWMETNIFARAEIRQALGGFVLSRLYTDGDGEIYEKQQALQEKKFSTVALPLYAIVNADGKPVATFSGLTRNPAEFLAFLKRASEPRS